jgi:hypothetical protein
MQTIQSNQYLNTQLINQKINDKIGIYEENNKLGLNSQETHKKFQKKCLSALDNPNISTETIYRIMNLAVKFSPEDCDQIFTTLMRNNLKAILILEDLKPNQISSRSDILNNRLGVNSQGKIDKKINTEAVKALCGIPLYNTNYDKEIKALRAEYAAQIQMYNISIPKDSDMTKHIAEKLNKIIANAQKNNIEKSNKTLAYFKASYVQDCYKSGINKAETKEDIIHRVRNTLIKDFKLEKLSDDQTIKLDSAINTVLACNIDRRLHNLQPLMVDNEDELHSSYTSPFREIQITYNDDDHLKNTQEINSTQPDLIKNHLQNTQELNSTQPDLIFKTIKDINLIFETIKDIKVDLQSKHEKFTALEEAKRAASSDENSCCRLF